MSGFAGGGGGHASWPQAGLVAQLLDQVDDLHDLLVAEHDGLRASASSGISRAKPSIMVIGVAGAGDDQVEVALFHLADASA